MNRSLRLIEPPGRLTFSPLKTCRIRSIGISFFEMASRSSFTVTADFRPPNTEVDATPCSRSISGVMLFSTRRRRSMPSTGEETVKVRAGRTSGLKRKITERSLPSGRVLSIALIFSLISETTVLMSVFHVKFTMTTESPSVDVEPTFCTPLIVETASSMGLETPLSTSKGPTPG